MLIMKSSGASTFPSFIIFSKSSNQSARIEKKKYKLLFYNNVAKVELVLRVAK